MTTTRTSMRFMFQSTHSLRSATSSTGEQPGTIKVSIHALLAECDPRTGEVETIMETVSIHALLAECDFYEGAKRFAYVVSIHALLAECDETLTKRKEPEQCFNPRTPCGVRLGTILRCTKKLLFQSTHSLRSATSKVAQPVVDETVSIHALLAECDLDELKSSGFSSAFQSTHSLRSATRINFRLAGLFAVSIHALLAECDWLAGKILCSI